MANNFFNVQVFGTESLAQDFANVNREIRDASFLGLLNVGTSMTGNLQYHIQRDVYNAYHPKSYPRRSDNPQFGVPMIDVSNMTSDVDERRLRLTFIYNPGGEHSGLIRDAKDYMIFDKGEMIVNPWYDGRENEPIKPKPVSGDKLIKRIETGEGYDWKAPEETMMFSEPDENGAQESKFPERPFWSLFLDGEKNGLTMEAFASGFSQGMSGELILEGAGDMEWSSADGALEA